MDTMKGTFGGVARRGDGDFMVVEKVVEAFEVLPTFASDRFSTP